MNVILGGFGNFVELDLVGGRWLLCVWVFGILLLVFDLFFVFGLLYIEEIKECIWFCFWNILNKFNNRIKVRGKCRGLKRDL